MAHIERNFGPWVIKHRWLIITLSIILVAAAQNGRNYIEIPADWRVFFSKDSPELIAFEELEKTYSKADGVLVVIAPENGDVFTRETLTAIEEMTEKAWQTPFSSRVDSITNFQYTRAEGDDLIVADLVSDANSFDDQKLRDVREAALAEPLLYKRLIGEGGRVAGINITVQLPRRKGTQINEVPAIVAHVREMRDKMEAEYPHLKIYLTGMTMLDTAFAESSINDMSTLIPATFGIMMLLLCVFTGRLTGTAGTLLVIWFSINSAMGLGGYFGLPLSSPAASAPTIILTVAVANCVHILVTISQEMRNGLDKHAAIIESLRVNLQPVTLASMTTTLGFLTMNFSDVPPFNDLGNFVAFGIVASYLLSTTFLPALLSLLPIRVKQRKQTTMLMARFAEFVVAQRSVLLWSVGSIILLLLLALPRNELNDVYVHYFNESIPFRQAADFTTENLTGLYTLYYSLESGQPQGLNDPAFLREVEAFASWYRAQPETIHVGAVTDVIKRLNKNMHNDAPDKYRLPNSKELTAQYLLLYEMSLPYGLDLNDQINVERSATRMTVSLKTISTKEILALNQRAEQWLLDNTVHIKRGEGNGTALMTATIGVRNNASMLLATTGALVMISFILIYALRSVKIGLISLIPNLAPAAMGFGLWGILVGEIGLSISVVATMTLGIVVDDTVHYLSKYLRARRENQLNSADAVRYAFNTVGRALIVTSVVLIVGFLMLSTSTFDLNAQMGLMTAIVIAFALLADFLFLPPLLMKFEEDKDAKAAVDNTALDAPAI